MVSDGAVIFLHLTSSVSRWLQYFEAPHELKHGGILRNNCMVMAFSMKSLAKLRDHVTSRV